MPGSTTRGDDPSSEAGRQARGNCPLRKRGSLPYLPRSRPLPAGAPVAGCGHSSACSADRRACPSACIHPRCDSVRQRHSLTLGHDGDAGQDRRLIALSKAADDLGASAERPLTSSRSGTRTGQRSTRAGIEHRVHPHALRHSLATALAHEGRRCRRSRPAWALVDRGHRPLPTTDCPDRARRCGT